MVKLICPVCNKSFKRNSWYIKQHKILTCSDRCRKEYMVGENSANWMDGRNQTNYTCEYCSKEFIAGKCEDRKYCSSECGHKDSAGKTRPKTGGRIKLTCDWCKVEFERLKCNVPDR